MPGQAVIFAPLSYALVMGATTVIRSTVNVSNTQAGNSEQRKKIVHVIDSLGRGGAETMLVDLLPDLASTYDVVLVTLGQQVDFPREQIVCSKMVNLHFKGVFDLPATIRELK